MAGKAQTPEDRASSWLLQMVSVATDSYSPSRGPPKARGPHASAGPASERTEPWDQSMQCLGQHQLQEAALDLIESMV